MRVDVHTHFQCLDFVKHLHGRSALPKSILDGGTYIIQCAPGSQCARAPKDDRYGDEAARTWKI